MSVLKLSDLYDASNDVPFISTDLGASTTLAYETFEVDTKSQYGQSTMLIGELPEPAADGHTREKVRVTKKLGKLIVAEARAAGRTELIPGDKISFTVTDKTPFGDEGKEAPVWDIAYDPCGDPNQAELFPEGTDPWADKNGPA